MPPHRAPSDVRSFLVLAALGAFGVALALGLSATGHSGAAVGAPGGAGLALLVAACVVALRLIRTSQYEMHRAQHAGPERLVAAVTGMGLADASGHRSHPNRRASA